MNNDWELSPQLWRSDTGEIQYQPRCGNYRLWKWCGTLEWRIDPPFGTMKPKLYKSANRARRVAAKWSEEETTFSPWKRVDCIER